jgi:nucleoside recognition membrane protein YjiH
MTNYNNKIYVKMFFYFIITTVITFSTVLDTIDATHINSMTAFEWVKMILKSVIPSLVTIKAFVDPSANEVTNNSTQSDTNK